MKFTALNIFKIENVFSKLITFSNAVLVKNTCKHYPKALVKKLFGKIYFFYQALINTVRPPQLNDTPYQRIKTL